MKKYFSFFLALITVISLCACSTKQGQPSTNQKVQSEEPITSPSTSESSTSAVGILGYKSYQEILDDYTVKIQEAVPGLIEEYNAEAAKNSDGLQGLATICNAKVSKLAEISNDGISEMAEFYYEHGSGSYEEYEEWAGKIMDIYMEEASKIQDAYMESAK